jgi:hypothetical protein
LGERGASVCLPFSLSSIFYSLVFVSVVLRRESWYIACLPTPPHGEHAYKSPSNDKKVVFDKTAFVKFKISNNFKQNIDETHSKTTKNLQENPYQPMEFKNLKKKICEPVVFRSLPNV